MCDLHEAAITMAAKINSKDGDKAAAPQSRKTISLDAERFLRMALAGCDTSPLQQRWHMQTSHTHEPALGQAVSHG